MNRNDDKTGLQDDMSDDAMQGDTGLSDTDEEGFFTDETR